jgi:hypothetical protein
MTCLYFLFGTILAQWGLWIIPAEIVLTVSARLATPKGGGLGWEESLSMESSNPVGRVLF